MQIAEKKGLVWIKPAEKLPDLLKIHEFIRVHGFPPAGCSYTPATVNFSFKTKRGEQDVEQSSETQTASQPIKLKLLHDQPLIGENGHGKYTMYAVENETGEQMVWFAPSTAHDVIQSQQLKTGSEIIVKLIAKNKVEVSILGKAAEPERDSKPDNLKNVMIQSMRDAAESVAAVPDLGFRAEDARAIGLSLFIARTKRL